MTVVTTPKRTGFCTKGSLYPKRPQHSSTRAGRYSMGAHCDGAAGTPASGSTAVRPPAGPGHAPVYAATTRQGGATALTRLSTNLSRDAWGRCRQSHRKRKARPTSSAVAGRGGQRGSAQEARIARRQAGMRALGPTAAGRPGSGGRERPEVPELPYAADGAAAGAPAAAPPVWQLLWPPLPPVWPPKPAHHAPPSSSRVICCRTP